MMIAYFVLHETIAYIVGVVVIVLICCSLHQSRVLG